jgi:hypothetical protein
MLRVTNSLERAKQGDRKMELWQINAAYGAGRILLQNRHGIDHNFLS